MQLFSYHSTRLGVPFETYSEWLHRLVAEFFHIDEDDEDWDLMVIPFILTLILGLVIRRRYVDGRMRKLCMVLLGILSAFWFCSFLFVEYHLIEEERGHYQTLMGIEREPRAFPFSLFTYLPKAPSFLSEAFSNMSGMFQHYHQQLMEALPSLW